MGHKILKGKAEIKLIRTCVACGSQKVENFEPGKRNAYDQNTLYDCMNA